MVKLRRNIRIMKSNNWGWYVISLGYAKENVHYVEIGVKTDHSLIKWYELETYGNVVKIYESLSNPQKGDSNSNFFLIIQSDVEYLCFILW